MKFRSDFVTNSSSSSFIVAFNSKQEGMETIIHMLKKHGSMFIDTLLEDFESATPIALNDIPARYHEEFESDAEWELDDTGHSWSHRPTFYEEWIAAHPNATRQDYYNSEERRVKIEEFIKQRIESLLQEIGDRSYVVELDYEDHDEIGSGLEHDILPNQDFTAWRFSHH